MADELLDIRHNVYRCGALFHRGMAKYFDALNADVAGEDLGRTAAAAREAGAAYNSALVALLKRLNSSRPEPEAAREAELAERAISLLSFELQRLTRSR